MHLDDDSQTTLSKWPFVLGDVLLVGTALAIAILGDWHLTNWQVAACVAAVALGAALFVLPYVVEFQVRVREECEDRAGDLRILEKHLLNAERELNGIDGRTRALERALADADKSDGALIEMVNQKLAQLETAFASNQGELHVLHQKLKELPADPPPAFGPETLKSLEKRLHALEARLDPGHQAADAASVKKGSGAATSASDRKTPAEESKETASPVDRSKRSFRERHGPEEKRLLQRAISEWGDNSSAAVNRIIGARKKEGTEPENELEARTNATEEEAPDMLFDEKKITSPITRTKARKDDAVVIASAFIGIGNKPYLRGSGGGLNWEQGRAMEFQEVGKWRWVAPPDLEASLEVQIYCNDEEPDQSGKHKLEPGQKLELKPIF